MTTVNEIILKARALLDEYTDEGVIIPEADVIDIQSKAILFCDMAQKELFRTNNIYDKLEIVQRNPDNLLGKFAHFDIKTFTGEDWTTDAKTARSYYFEANDEGSCVIEEYESGAWQTLSTITMTDTDDMTAYKGLIVPTTTGNLIRLRFTGTTYYEYTNIALFGEPFKLYQIPTYKPWIPVAMPSNFRMVDKIVEEYPERQYNVSANYKWEGFNQLWINYYFYGTIRVIYKPIPTTLTAITDSFECDDVTANAITYYVAAKIAPHEYPELTNFFEQKYNELKMESFIKMPSSEQSIVDVYGGFYGNV